MQQYVQFRSISKVIGWIHFVFSIFGVIGSIILIGLISYILSDPSYLESLDPSAKKSLETGFVIGILGLIYYILGLGVLCVDIWISKGLINATDIGTSISNALRLAKRWRLWFIVITVVYILIDFIINPFLVALIEAVITLMIKGLICYLVHRYIQSLEEAHSADCGSASANF